MLALPICSDDYCYHRNLQWLEETFLPYLDDWEKGVAERKGFTKTERNKMVLSTETLLGLRMTSMFLLCF